MEILVITQIITALLLLLSEVMGATRRGPNGVVNFVFTLCSKKVTVDIKDDDDFGTGTVSK
jgi:hypothetical protein